MTDAEFRKLARAILCVELRDIVGELVREELCQIDKLMNRTKKKARKKKKA